MRTWTRHTLLLVGLVLATAVPALAVGQDKAPANKQEVTSVPKGLRVFVCGHSLHWYIPTPLAEMAKAAGINDHQLVGQQSLGGSRTQQHWDLPDEKNQAKQALKKGIVDVFTMSPKEFPDEGIENFVKLGLEHNPSMRFTVQISWSRYDADPFNLPNGEPKGFSREKNPELLKKVYEKNIKLAEAQADEINKKHGKGKKVLLLVPSVHGSIALRTKVYNKQIPGLTTQNELFSDAMGHASPPLELVNTYLHFAVIYGQSPVGLPMPSILKNAKKAGWDEKLTRTLQELSWEAVTSFPPSGVKAASGK